MRRQKYRQLEKQKIDKKKLKNRKCIESEKEKKEKKEEESILNVAPMAFIKRKTVKLKLEDSQKRN